mmetsp:Transcript_2465/g.3608  ORF Transcript_2465/g.3608 Transcript_2465/m.3608 type:complete len:240 (+) Transcript_2465:45-764(+)
MVSSLNLIFILSCCLNLSNAFSVRSSFNGNIVKSSTPSYTPPRHSHSNGLQMKIFDWKLRENDHRIEGVETFTVTNLFPAPGSRHRKKRKGRGIAAGQGASCGFGMRGQKSRSGRSVRPGFEGGQTPLYRRIPKYVGRPMGPGHTKKEFNLISLNALNSVSEGSTVSFDSLFEQGAVTKTKHRWHKVIGNGELGVKSLTVQAHAFTNTAKEAIEKNGGKCQLLSPTTNKVLDMAEMSTA